jgi:hypothetical protein
MLSDHSTRHEGRPRLGPKPRACQLPYRQLFRQFRHVSTSNIGINLVSGGIGFPFAGLGVERIKPVSPMLQPVVGPVSFRP